MKTHNMKQHVVCAAVISIAFCLFNNGAVNAADPFEGVYGSFTTVDGNAETIKVDTGDYDHSHVKTNTATLPTNGTRRLFYLPHHPIVHLISVAVNGAPLDPRDPNTYESNYSFHPKNGWITFKQAYAVPLTVTYEYSTELDIAAANYPNTQKEMIYKHDGNFAFTEDPINIPKPSGVLYRGLCVAFGDPDGDGKLDLVRGIWDNYGELLVNSGGFPVYQQTVPINQLRSMKFYDIVWGDYDSDGDLDLATANRRKRYAGLLPFLTHQYHFKENGLPVITDGWLDYTTMDMNGIEFGDFDLDGDLDILSAAADATAGVPELQVWRNQVTPGPFMYTATSLDVRISKIDAGTLRQVSSIGRAGPVGNYEYSNSIAGICVDDQYIYIADKGNGRIVQLHKSDFHYERQKTGLTPYGVAEHGSFIYITSSNNVYKLDKLTLGDVGNGGTSISIGGFSNPKGLDAFYNPVANQVEIYVCDSGNARIVMLDENLNGLGTANPGGMLTEPFDIAVDTTAYPTTSEIFIVDAGSADTLIKCDLDFTNPTSIGGTGTGDDQFNDPKSVTFDDTYVYVIDSGNDRLHRRNKYDLSLDTIAPLETWPTCIDYDKYKNAPPERRFELLWQTNNISIKKIYANVECADLDNDGDLDFIATHDNAFEIYKNNIIGGASSALFTLMLSSQTGRGEIGISVADVDMDGDIDIALANNSTGNSCRVTYLKNNGSFNFKTAWSTDQDPTPQYNNFQGSDVHLADINGDGAIDLTASAQDSAGLKNEYLGIVVFKGAASGFNITTITSKAKRGKEKITIIMRYKTNEDGTLGELISTEIKP